MKTILILGAGLSSSALIDYFLDLAPARGWKIRVGDIHPELAKEKIHGSPQGTAFEFDVLSARQRNEEIGKADIVISMLPVKMHFLVAETCIQNGKNLVTASYCSEELWSLDKAAKKKGIVLMNECGVDPGIDHMSAMKMIHRIERENGTIQAFESSTGGLVAPGYENNPWHYKFTWNPRNVVLAGKDGARFLHNGKYKYIPYHKIFQRTETIQVPSLGEFEVYGNRDSLRYRTTYGLNHLQTMFRGTIRRPGFCEAWDIFVQLGATDDTYIMEETDKMTYRDFINSFMAFSTGIPVESKLARYLHFEEDSEMMKRLQWLGIFENKMIGNRNLTPAMVLQHILEEKWKMESGDKDMILMQHQFNIRTGQKRIKRYATMTYIGNDDKQTAMSATVGLPVAITAKTILEGKYALTGVQLPIHPSIYQPVLQELESLGIRFIEEETTLP